jgi:hypothetical protein
MTFQSELGQLLSEKKNVGGLRKYKYGSLFHFEVCTFVYSNRIIKDLKEPAPPLLHRSRRQQVPPKQNRLDLFQAIGPHAHEGIMR